MPAQGRGADSRHGDGFDDPERRRTGIESEPHIPEGAVHALCERRGHCREDVLQVRVDQVPRALDARTRHSVASSSCDFGALYRWGYGDYPL